MRWTTRPIQQWPGTLTPYRRDAPFKAAWSTTLRTLDVELTKLRASDVILQRAYSEDDLRLDGEPRANARAAHPGVILCFDSTRGPLRFVCDRFSSWQDNVRAIALGLEALRKVERYGITTAGEQYTGWQALPAGGTTLLNARALLRTHGGFTAAVKRFHPDNPVTGDRAMFDRIMAAIAVTDEAGDPR